MFRGKNYKESEKLIDKQALYDPQEAFDLVCKASRAKFDETVELHVKLGVDSRHADQQVRGAVVLPNGTGKTVRVLVFCKPEREEEAKAAGADYAGGQDLVQKIQQEKVFHLGVYTIPEISAQFFLVKIFVEAKEGEDCKARPDGVNGCFGAVIHPAGGKDFLYALLPAGIKGQTAAAEGFAVVRGDPVPVPDPPGEDHPV